MTNKKTLKNYYLVNDDWTTYEGFLPFGKENPEIGSVAVTPDFHSHPTCGFGLHYVKAYTPEEGAARANMFVGGRVIACEVEVEREVKIDPFPTNYYHIYPKYKTNKMTLKSITRVRRNDIAYYRWRLEPIYQLCTTMWMTRLQRMRAWQDRSRREAQANGK